MSAQPTSLISKLRRRLAMAAWAFALIVAGQSALATLCFTDGFTASNPASVVASQAHAAPLSLDSETSHDAPCWHAGSGGCHCTCAHASGLPITASAWIPDRIASAHALARAIAPYAAPVPTNLRPPIA